MYCINKIMFLITFKGEGERRKKEKQGWFMEREFHLLSSAALTSLCETSGRLQGGSPSENLQHKGLQEVVAQFLSSYQVLKSKHSMTVPWLPPHSRRGLSSPGLMPKEPCRAPRTLPCGVPVAAGHAQG